jgi:hypothetical protein
MTPSDGPGDHPVGCGPAGAVSRFDGMVGTIADGPDRLPFGGSVARLVVSVAGDGMADDVRAVLRDDLAVLVEGFLRRPHVEAEPAADATAEQQADDDVHVALHGVRLGPEAERELRRRVRAMARNRSAGDRAQR